MKCFTKTHEGLFYFQIPTSDIIKDLPLKKQKLDEYMNLPFKLQQQNYLHQIYATLDPQYIQQYLHEINNPQRHLSAFKPVTQTIKESKIRHANALGITTRYADPPLLQNPERVVRISESERFERSFQPNVALAPPTPKKHRYGKGKELFNKEIKSDESPDSDPATVIVKEEIFEESSRVSPEKSTIIQSTAMVQQTPVVQKYNPEIELSTDTDDSASESSEKILDPDKVEDILLGVDNAIKLKILNLFSQQEKLISDLKIKNSELKKEVEELRKSAEKREICNNNNDNDSECSENTLINTNCSSINKSKDIVNGTEEKKSELTNGFHETKEEENIVEAIEEKNDKIDTVEQPTVIASVEKNNTEKTAIIKSAVE